MTTRRIILIIFCVLLALGVGNFTYNSLLTRSQLGAVAGKDAAAQESGIKSLMARGILFDALQGGAPPATRLAAIEALQRMADGGKNPAAFKELLQMLKDPDTESAEAKTHPVRDAAKDAVAKVGTGYPDIIMDAAKDPDKNIQDQSRLALKAIGAPMKEKLAGRLGDAKLRAPFGDILSSIGPETISLIAPYLQPPLLKTDAKPDDLAAAKVELIETLGKFKVADAARPILPFKDDTNPNVRRSVVTSLANIADPVGAPVLIAALSNPDTDASARAAAAGALGAIATPEANNAMLKALSDYDLSVSAAAAAGLKRAGSRAETFIAQAFANPDPAVRARAADASGGLRSTDLAAKALTDSDAVVRANGAVSLGDILFRALTITTDLTALAQAGDDKAKVKAYQSLQTHGDTAELLRAGAPPQARPNAIAALTALREAKKTPADRKPFDDQIAKLTVGAVPDDGQDTPLVSAQSPAAFAPLIAPLIAALGDADGTVAQTAARSLSRLGVTAAAPLVVALASPNDTIAYYASQSLSAMGQPAVAVVLPVAQRGKPGARWAAITLGQIGDSRAASDLEALSKSPDADTAAAAAAALAKVRPG